MVGCVRYFTLNFCEFEIFHFDFFDIQLFKFRFRFSALMLIQYYTFFFISNPIFRLSLQLLSEVPKMRLKVAMKLLTFFDDYRLK